MPREAIRAIAYCGYFFGASAAFLAYYAWRQHYPVIFVAINTLTTLFLLAGSYWMLAQLKKGLMRQNPNRRLRRAGAPQP